MWLISSPKTLTRSVAASEANAITARFSNGRVLPDFLFEKIAKNKRALNYNEQLANEAFLFQVFYNNLSRNPAGLCG